MSLWKNRPDREDEPGDAPERPERLEAHERREEGKEMANIGKSITIKGDVTGDEDLVIEGRVEGRIDLKNHLLTIGQNGDVSAEISAKQVTIVGKVAGNVTATERLEIQESGRVEGDVTAPRLLVQEGAQLNGAITMKPSGAQTQPQVAQQKRPAAPTPPGPTPPRKEVSA